MAIDEIPDRTATSAANPLDSDEPSADSGPLVSVVIRTMGRDELVEALDSVAEQTYRNIEVILVDAKGRGELPSQGCCGQFPVRIASTGAPLGRGAAANVGLEAAVGDYVVFLDDDDWFLPDHVASLVGAVMSSPGAAAAYAGIVCKTKNDAGGWESVYIFNQPYDPVRLLVENYLPIHSVLFRRSLVGIDLHFDESLDVYEDWDFWIQLSAITSLVHVDRVTAIYRITGASGFGLRAADPAIDTGKAALFDKWRLRWSLDQALKISEYAKYRSMYYELLRDHGHPASAAGVLPGGVVDPNSDLKRMQLEVECLKTQNHALEQRIRTAEIHSNSSRELLGVMHVELLDDAIEVRWQLNGCHQARKGLEDLESRILTVDNGRQETLRFLKGLQKGFVAQVCQASHAIELLRTALGSSSVGYHKTTWPLFDPFLRASINGFLEHRRAYEVAVRDRDANVAKLSQTVTTRDGQIAGLNQALLEREGQIAGLNQAVAEREGQIAALNQAVAEREGQMAGLNQTVAEREGQIAALNQTVAEQDEANARLSQVGQELADARAMLGEMHRSRSWRLTAPYRAVGHIAKRAVASVAQTGLLQRTTVGLLLLPSAVAYYGGVGGAIRAFRPGSGYVAKLMQDQLVVRERLLERQRLFRWPAFVGFALASRILQAGSVSRAIANVARIFRSEGVSGVRMDLMAGVPGLAAPTVAAWPKPLTPIQVDAALQPDPRRILVADYRVPMADVSAGERATVGILGDLCAFGFEVVFLPNDMAPSPRYEEKLRQFGVTTVNASQGYPSAQDYLRQHGRSFATFYLIRFDVVESMLGVIREVAPHARVIFHAPDVYFLREGRESELTGCAERKAQAEATRERELAAIRQADHTVIVSPAELLVLRELMPDAKISVFPVLYAPVTPRVTRFGDRSGIFFLGGFGHGPNADAAQWFVAEIWPLVRKKLPETVFYIVGSEVPESVRALEAQPGVRVLGYVEHLDPLMAFLRVGVAPLRFGAGIKGKVAMMMGAGVPCVCTEIAAEGMGIQDGVHALVADEPQRFAEAVVALYTDAALWDCLSKNGPTLVRERFGDEANRAALLKVLDNARVLPLSLFGDYCRNAKPVPVPSPSKDEAVDVSIIVPVYNKWELTHACLTSIVQTSVGVGVRYEVILADDGSTDETLQAEAMFPGLRVVRTPTNLGFLRNCNHASKYARGRHILLLNNDTVVLPGWLDALYCTMEADDTIAITGSKLLYPDGAIQEAGAALFSDGTAINVGRGANRWADVFSIEREVDYISGASILIRGSFWSGVGGFDERYKNAYCEDSDMAMTARANGMRVVYVPTSEVVHFEHGSYAEQAPTHNASLQKHNITLLVEKWNDVLHANHLPPSEWQLAASLAERSTPVQASKRRRAGKLNILYFSPFPSHPVSHGNRATINSFSRRFQELGHRVHFALLQSHEYGDTDVAEMAAAWDSLDVLPYSNPMVADRHEVPFDGWYEEGLGERVRVLCATYDIDIVFCSYIFQCKLLEFVPSHILRVIDTHDKMGDRYEMLRRNGQPLEFFSCTPEDEGAYLRRADVVVARREEEARYFNAVSGRSTAIVIPHFEDPHFVAREFKTLSRVGIVASANRINLAIIRELLEAVNREIKDRPCPFTVHIAGQVKDMLSSLPPDQTAVFGRPWVHLLGFVPDIGPFYSSVDVVVSPVTMGTGINVKTVQAMAYGMPLMTTTWGSKGIETEEPMHMHPDIESLVRSLLRLPEAPAELERLARVSREQYQRFFEGGVEQMRGLLCHKKLQMD